MYTLFIDDSKQSRPTRSDVVSVFGFGGCLINNSEIPTFNAIISSTRSLYGLPEREPFKYSPNPRSYVHSNIVGEARSMMRHAVTGCMREVNATLFASVVDLGYGMYRNPKPGTDALQNLFERVEMHVAPTGEEVKIVMNVPGGGKRNVAAARERITQILDAGTRWVQFQHFRHDAELLPSKASFGLQAADQVISSTVNWFSGEQRYAPVVVGGMIDLFCGQPHNLYGWGLKASPHSLYMW